MSSVRTVRATMMICNVRPGDVIVNAAGEPMVRVLSITPLRDGPYVKVDGEPFTALGDVWASRRHLVSALVTVDREEIV